MCNSSQVNVSWCKNVYIFVLRGKKTFVFIFCCKHLHFFIDDIKSFWSQAVCRAFFFKHSELFYFFQATWLCIWPAVKRPGALLWTSDICFWRPSMNTVLSVSRIAHTSEMFACLILRDSSEHLIIVPAFIQDAHSRAATALNSLYL